MVRSTSLSIVSLGKSSVSGLPLTVVRRGITTMFSPCAPSTQAETSLGETLSSAATKVLSRAESSTPDMPTTRCRGELTGSDGKVGHGVERVADHEDNALRRIFDDVSDDPAHDFSVGQQQLIAGHARFAEEPRGDDDQLGVGGILVVAGAGEPYLGVEDGRRLQYIQRLTLRQPLDDIEQDDLGVAPLGDALGTGRAHIPRPDNADLGYFASLIFLITASATCEVPTDSAPLGFMS